MIKTQYRNPFGSVLEQIKRAKAEREQRAEIYRDTHEIVSRAFDAPTITDVAAKIIRAGQLRRGEVEDPRTRPDTSTESGRRALAIINAGRKRRNEPLL
jgi:hypothetical protein